MGMAMLRASTRVENRIMKHSTVMACARTSVEMEVDWEEGWMIRGMDMLGAALSLVHS